MGALAGRRERRQWAPEPVIPPFPGANLFGRGGGTPNVAARPNESLQVPAVWACVTLIANTVASMRLETFRQTGDVSKRITSPRLVTNPAAGMTQSEWLHMLLVSLLLRGNAFGLKSFDERFNTTQIELLNPDALTVRVEDGRTVYRARGTGQDLTSRMWHVRGLTLPGDVVGLSPIAYAARAIGVDLSSRQFAQDFFDGSGVPKGVLSSDQMLDREQAVFAKEQFKSGTTHRDIAVLGRGLAYQQISIAPEESQFLETQQANISEIARFFTIPAEMIGCKSGSSMTYSNVEQRTLDFLTYCVAFWLRRVEDAFFDLLPQPQFVEFDVKSLLRTDAETEAKVRAIYVAAKVMPPSRILAQMNEEPLTQAEKEELELVPLAITATGMPRSTMKGGAPNVDPSETVEPESAPGQTPTTKSGSTNG